MRVFLVILLVLVVVVVVAGYLIGASLDKRRTRPFDLTYQHLQYVEKAAKASSKGQHGLAEIYLEAAEQVKERAGNS